MASTEEQVAIATLRRWRADPVAFVVENFNAKPDQWQGDALRAIARPDVLRLALKACKGPGKTCVLAWILLWFLATRPQAKIAATSITGDNLKDNLWSEVALWLGRSPFLRSTFTWTQTRVFAKEAPETWFATARSWPKSADANRQADTLAGIHADYVLFILDESSEIPLAVMATAEAVLASGKEAKLIQAGNPTRLDGPLYAACGPQKALWHVITITGDPDNPKRSPRVKIDWARQQIATYGRENPWVMVNVLGEFPPSSINALLGIADVEAAMDRRLPGHLYDWSQKRLGVDVARFGDDRTVIFPRQGLAAFMPKVMRNARTTDIAAAVARYGTRWGAEVIFVDDTGHWGHGVIDNLVTVRNLNVIPLVYSAKAISPRYKNRRAEFWIAMADAIKAGQALPNIPELVGELITPTYTFTNGQFLLEDKEQVKERLGRSPDLADALAETFAIPDMPADMMAAGTAQAHARTQDDREREMRNLDRTEGVGRAAHDFDPWR